MPLRSEVESAIGTLATLVVADEGYANMDERGRRIATVANGIKVFIEAQSKGLSTIQFDEAELLEEIGVALYEQLRYGVSTGSSGATQLVEWEEMNEWKRESWRGEAAALLHVDFDADRITAASKEEA